MDELHFDGKAAVRLLRAAVAAAGLASCQVPLDQEELDFDFSEARTRCVVPSPAGVTRSGAFSIALPEGSYFVFEQTWQDQGDGFRITGSSGAVSPAGGHPCDEFVELVGDDGYLVELIARSPEEVAADEAAADGRTTMLFPISGFERGSEGVVFYVKARMANLFDVVAVGVGVAVLRYGEPAERLRPNRYAEEPTLLWISPQDGWATSAFVGRDGLAYVYGCYRRAEWDDVCRVARVSPGSVDDPDAYRYFDGDDFTPNVTSAAVIASELQGVSVAYSAHRGRYVGFQTGYLENRVLGSLAPTPAGEFGRQHELFVGEAPSQFWIRDLELHAGYASADGRRFLLSYWSDPAYSTPGMRFVEVTLK